MSRVAKKIINMPKGVELKDVDGVLSVKGPKGTLTMAKPSGVSLSNENGMVQLGAANPDDMKMAGTTRAILANMMTGVSEGFTRKLELVGVGYRAAMQGKDLNLRSAFRILCCSDADGSPGHPDADRNPGLGADKQRSAKSPPRSARIASRSHTVQGHPLRRREDHHAGSQDGPKAFPLFRAQVTDHDTRTSPLRRAKTTRSHIRELGVAACPCCAPASTSTPSFHGRRPQVWLRSGTPAVRRGRRPQGTGHIRRASRVGSLIAERAVGRGCEKVAFDALGLRYPRPLQGPGRGGARGRPQVVRGIFTVETGRDRLQGACITARCPDRTTQL